MNENAAFSKQQLLKGGISLKMDLDELQETLGGISYYQIGIIATVTALAYGNSFMGQSAAIFSAAPEFRCSIPLLDNTTHYPELANEEIRRLMLPKNDSCSRYDVNLSMCAASRDLSCVTESPNSTIPCDHGYIYDTTYYDKTTVSEWNLVCNRVTLDSVAVSLYFLGVLIGSLIIGPTMDWFGRRVSMLVTCCATILAGLGVAFSPSYEVYIAMRTIVGIGSVPCYVAYFTYVIELTPTNSRTGATVFATLVTALSHTTLPVFAMVIRDWRHLAICLSLLPGSYLVTFFFVPESPRWLLGKGRTADARKVLERYARSHQKSLNDEHWALVVKTEEENVTAAKANDRHRYTMRDLFRLPMMRIVSLVVLYLWFTASMVFYGLVLNVWRLSGHPHINGILNGSVEILSYFALWGFLRLTGMRIACFLSFFLSGACCLMTMSLTQFSNGSTGMMESAKWFAITGKFFATAMFAVAYKYAAELYPTMTRGNAVAMGSTAARVGTVILPFTLQLQLSVPWLTQTIFGIMGIAGGFLSLLLPETSAIDLLSTFEQAEKFYRDKMWISRFFRKTTKTRADPDYDEIAMRDKLGQDQDELLA